MLASAMKTFRLYMPQHERMHAWLPLLLDCYAMIDFSVSKAIRCSDKNVACCKGCSACCYQPIPVSTLEGLGIKFYTSSILDKNMQSLLLEKNKGNDSICLFNVADCCLVYPMRPIACRRYIVTTNVCGHNEDVNTTRPDDVIVPDRSILYDAVQAMLPFYTSQSIYPLDHESAFEFYKRNNVILSSIYDVILGLHK